MKTALVLHPRFTLYGGGEVLCLYTCKALQAADYHVQLACDHYDPDEVEKMYGLGLGKIMAECEHVQLPPFKKVFPRFMALQRLEYAKSLSPFFKRLMPDIVFSTQSTIYFLGGRPVYHFIYDMVDLQSLDMRKIENWKRWAYYRLLQRYREYLDYPEPNRHFLGLSRNIQADLVKHGYANTGFIWPPVPKRFSPMEKVKRVIQVTRIVPQKRLEEFLEIARWIPEYTFVIVGRESPVHPGYKEGLLEDAPENLVYIERPIREVPELLAESMIYLYTSHEPGLPLAVTEGLMAGCVPVVSSEGAGSEVVQDTGIGEVYYRVEDAVKKIRSIIESGYPVHPSEIAQRADQFKPENYMLNIQKLLT